MQDELLIKQLKNRDMAAFEQIVGIYKNYVGAVVKNRISSSMGNEDVEEAIADVFFALWKSCDKLDAGKGSIKNYLGMIARNIAVNKLRERKNTLPLDEDMELQTIQTPESEVLHNETLDIIKMKISKLRSPDREVFTKYHLDGKSIIQISQEMGLNQNTIKAKLARSRKKLKKLLSEGGVYYEC